MVGGHVVREHACSCAGWRIQGWVCMQKAWHGSWQEKKKKRKHMKDVCCKTKGIRVSHDHSVEVAKSGKHVSLRGRRASA